MSEIRFHFIHLPFRLHTSECRDKTCLNSLILKQDKSGLLSGEIEGIKLSNRNYAEGVSAKMIIP